MAWPILIEVSLSPSVSDHPAGHFARSMVKPPGPVTVLPSADLPHLLSLMRFTTASRCLAHRASHSSIDVGCAADAVVAVDPAVVALPPVVAGAAVVVAASEPLSSPPQAAATRARPSRAAPTRRTGALLTFPPRDGAGRHM